MAQSAGSERHRSQSSSPDEDPLTLKFIELQYDTIRREIETSRERHFKLTAGALTIFPVFQVLASIIQRSIETGSAGAGALFLLAPLPIIILTLYTWYYAEHQTIARCARYLRDNVEAAVPGFTGWETWLQQQQEQRGTYVRFQEHMQAVVLNGLYISLYISAAALAIWQVSLVSDSALVTVGAVVVYAVVLVAILLTVAGMWRRVLKMWVQHAS